MSQPSKTATDATKPPTDAEMDRLEKLCAAATPGPWDFRAGGKFSYGSVDGIKAENIPPHVVAMYCDEQGRKCTAFVLVCSSTTLDNAANAELCWSARNALPRLLAALRKANERTSELERVCAEAYQLAGAYDVRGELVKALDNLSAAASGKPIPHETFLPVGGWEQGLKAANERVEELQQEVARLERHATERGFAYLELRQNIEQERDDFARRCMAIAAIESGEEENPHSLNEIIAMVEVAMKQELAASDQRISFAYGNTSIENPRITKDMVREEAAKLDAKRAKEGGK